MERRNFIRQAGVLGLISLTPVHELQRILNEDNPFEIKKLRNDIYTFTERGGTIAFKVNKEGVVVVDTQFPEQAGHLIEDLKKRSVNRVNLLINTHHHWDHTAGNIAFRDLAAMILAHENSKKNQMRVARERDTETGASIANWIKTLEEVHGAFDDETLFVYGHAGEGWPVTGKREDLKAMANYLYSLLEFMEKEVKAGKSLEEITEAATGIPGAPEWQGRGLGRNLQAAWNEVRNSNFKI